MANRCSNRAQAFPMRILLIYNYKYIILLLISSRKVQIWTHKPWLFCLVSPLGNVWLGLQVISSMNKRTKFWSKYVWSLAPHHFSRFKKLILYNNGTDLLNTKFCWLIMLRLVCVLKTFSAIYSLLKQCNELENLNRSSKLEVIMCVE